MLRIWGNARKRANAPLAVPTQTRDSSAARWPLASYALPPPGGSGVIRPLGTPIARLDPLAPPSSLCTSRGRPQCCCAHGHGLLHMDANQHLHLYASHGPSAETVTKRCRGHCGDTCNVKVIAGF